MCGGPKIPDQDPRFADAALRQTQLAEKQYTDYMAPGGDRDWMRSTTNDALDVYRAQAEKAGRLQDYQLGAMKRNDDRYWGTAVPYEDALIKRVDEMDSSAYRERQAGLARADVEQSFGDVAGQTFRSYGRYGISADSPAAIAAMEGQQRSKALAMVSAANRTRMAAEQMGLANKMQLYGGMRGMAGLGATSAQLALGAGGAAGGAASGMTGSVSGAINDGRQALTTYGGVNSAGVGAYNNYYGNTVSGYKVEADNDPTKSMMGAAAGVATAAAIAF